MLSSLVLKLSFTARRYESGITNLCLRNLMRHICSHVCLPVLCLHVCLSPYLPIFSFTAHCAQKVTRLKLLIYTILVHACGKSQNIQIESSSSVLLISSWLAPYSAQSEDTQSKVVSSNFSEAPACRLTFQLPSLKHVSLSVSSNWHCVMKKSSPLII